jgi:exonuclease VII large subunit
VESLETAVRARAARLGPLALGHIGRGDERLMGWRRLVAAYDVDRQLERGYTLTLGPDGDLIRSAADVAPDGALVTRFADGTVRSRVEATEMKEKD